LREGVALLRGAITLASEMHLTSTEFRALNNLGTGLSFEDPVGTLALTRDGLLRARRLGQRDYELTLGRVSGALSIGCGTWDETLATLDELERGPVPDDMTVAFAYQRATFALCRGQLADGERLIAIADALLPGLSNPTPHAIIEVARSVRHFVRADYGAAHAAGMLAARMSREFTTNGAEAAARAAVQAGDLGQLTAAIALLESTQTHGALVDAQRETWRAASLALRGESSQALPAYVAVLKRWADLRAAWDEALAALDMVTLLDPTEPQVMAAAEIARATFVRLGAAPFLELLDAALTRSAAVT
jgi:hypothetical protein